MAYHNLDLLDKKILKLIAEDARIPFLEVARVCNVSGAAIHQRIQKLTNLGILKGSQFIIDPEMIGYATCAYIGLCLKDPENFSDVVESLKKIPEVVECHYTTGGFDMFIKIYAFNNHHLLDIIHDKL
ncbi:MAG: Lrp/AsnC family transcriptional regulator, partial [Prevotella sp.]